MTKITNTAAGPRGVETDSGTVFVDPGQTVDVDVAKGHQLYDGLVEASSDDKALKSLNKDELLKIAGDAGIATIGEGDAAIAVADATKAQLVDAIEASRAATV
jgi:hypothetical protein